MGGSGTGAGRDKGSGGENDGGGRKLRSKDGRNDKRATLFNFDNINKLVYRDVVITVKKPSDFVNVYCHSQDCQLPDTSQVQKASNLTEIRLGDDGRVQRKVADPLPDDVFMMFHKKMKKDERVMANEDRLRILSEVDNLQTQLNLLNQYDWVRHLPSICSINDVRDYDELVEKKDLTVLEIENSLRKYDSWKRRSDQLAHDIKANLDASDGDKEYTLPLETIRANRKRENRQKYGPVIKLYLNNGYLLVIDPIQPPRIVKTQPDRLRDSGLTSLKNYKSNGVYKPNSRKHRERKRHTIAAPKPASPPPPLPPISTIRIPKNQSLENASCVDLMTSSENGMIFGTRLSEMKVPHDGFVLPKLIKNMSRETDQL